LKLVQIVFSGLGGHSSVGFSLIDADLGRKYSHTVIFYGIEEVSEGYKNKCDEMGIDYFFVKKQAGLDIHSQKQIISLLKKIEPDIILLHAISIILPVSYYCLFHKTRLISVEHQSNELKTKKDWILSLLIMALSEKTVYLTGLYRAQVKKKLGFVFRSKKSKVINNGINTAVFNAVNDNTGIDERQDKAIGMLSRFTENKDHLVLLEAFDLLLKKNDNRFKIKLLLAGDGVTKTNLLEKVAQLNLQDDVVFCGRLSEEESAIFLNKINLYVHASLGETMSTAIMQAMACKKPVIASDVTGINNMLINGQTGLLVAAGNPQALADAMWKLLDEKALADMLANNALEFAKNNFTNTIMFNRYHSLFIETKK
jgi:glycosyltransferase involved in cell wall biosynthesis